MVFDWLNIEVTEGTEGTTNVALSANCCNDGNERELKFRVVMPDNVTCAELTVKQLTSELIVISYDGTEVGYNGTLIGY
ncbi:MAG: hypothetical protein R3Y50_06070 [Rikenellaceae bacterium]